MGSARSSSPVLTRRERLLEAAVLPVGALLAAASMTAGMYLLGFIR